MSGDKGTIKADKGTVYRAGDFRAALPEQAENIDEGPTRTFFVKASDVVHTEEMPEAACWPREKAERRYAGVSHIEVKRVLDDDGYARHILDYKAGKEDVIRASRKLLMGYLQLLWRFLYLCTPWFRTSPLYCYFVPFMVWRLQCRVRQAWFW